MNGLPYYKAYPRDFIEGTIGMPFEVKGAYRLVLDIIYMQGGKLPDDARYISGLLGCSVRKWNALRAELVERGKLQVIGEFLTNYRAVSELEILVKHQEKQRENGSKPKKNKGLQKPPLNHTEPEPEPDKRLGGGGSSACVREAVAPTPPPDPPPPPDHPTLRERILEACGADPTSGLTGRGGQQLGRREHMAEVDRWLALPGIGEAEVVSVVREMMAGKRDGPPTTFRYFTPGIERLSAALTAPPIHPSSAATGARLHGQTPGIAFDLAHREYTRRLAAGEIRRGPDPADPWAS